MGHALGDGGMWQESISVVGCHDWEATAKGEQKRVEAYQTVAIRGIRPALAARASG